MILRFAVVACIGLLAIVAGSCHVDVDPQAPGPSVADRQHAPRTTPMVCGSQASSRLQDAAIWSLATGLVLTLALIVTFSEIKPKDVPYMPRAGCEWYEGRLNGCDRLAAIPHQPFNTYSTIMFALGGTFSAFQFAANSSIGLVFMLSMIVLCIASALFHGLPTRWSGHLDVIATYFVYSALAVLALAKALSSIGMLTWLQPYTAELMLLVGLVGAVVLRMLFRQSAEALMMKVAVVLGVTYACAIYLLLRLAPMPTNQGWLALLGSLVLFGIAFILQRIDFRKSRTAIQRQRSADAEPERRSTPLIGKTLHAFWHIGAAVATCALFYALLYPDIASGKC